MLPVNRFPEHRVPRAIFQEQNQLSALNVTSCPICRCRQADRLHGRTKFYISLCSNTCAFSVLSFSIDANHCWVKSYKLDDHAHKTANHVEESSPLCVSPVHVMH